MSESPLPENKPNEVEIQIFEAALRVFGEKGFHGANTQEIADLAGISKPSLHYYFRRKTDLYDSALSYAVDLIMFEIHADLVPGMSAEDSLAMFVRSLMNAYLERPWTLKVFIHDALNGGELAAFHLNRLSREKGSPVATLINNLKAGRETGEIRESDASHWFVTALSACAFPILIEPLLMGSIPGPKRDSTKFMETRAQEVFEQLWEGMRIR